MKQSSILRALTLFLPLALFAGSNTSMLLQSESSRVENGKTIFTDSVTVIFKNTSENIHVSAGEITVEQIFDGQGGGKNFLKCSSDTTIRTAGRTIKGKDVMIELGDTMGNIYILNPNGIVISNPSLNPNGVLKLANGVTTKSDFESWTPNQASGALPTFETPLDSRVGTRLQQLVPNPPVRFSAPSAKSQP